MYFAISPPPRHLLVPVLVEVGAPDVGHLDGLPPSSSSSVALLDPLLALLLLQAEEAAEVGPDGLLHLHHTCAKVTPVV